MENLAIIIPALDPTYSLVEYVKALLGEGFAHIIIVNDGSKVELTKIFNEIANDERCTILTHPINRGKGRALKTAFRYFLTHFSHLDGVITADADGQHSVIDVCNVAKTLVGCEEGIILGARSLNEPNVPIRSYFGNKATSRIFQFLYGNKLADTQTGLRGFPKKELPKILKLNGEHYEYEINMLVYAAKMNLTITEVPIQTLYFHNNASSHYKPVKDSVRVIGKLLSGLLYYSFSTIISGIIDIAGFSLLVSFLLVSFPLELRVLYAVVVARLISSFCNYYMNRKHVFKGKNKLTQSIIKYYTLCLGQVCASYLLIILINLFIGIHVILAKICIDSILGILSYQFQLHWVFHKNHHSLKSRNVSEKL